MDPSGGGNKLTQFGVEKLTNLKVFGVCVSKLFFNDKTYEISSLVEIWLRWMFRKMPKHAGNGRSSMGSTICLQSID